MYRERLIEIWCEPILAGIYLRAQPSWRYLIHSGDGYGNPSGRILRRETSIDCLWDLAEGLAESTGPHPATDMSRLPRFATRPVYFDFAWSWDDDEFLFGDFGQWYLVDINSWVLDGLAVSRPL